MSWSPTDLGAKLLGWLSVDDAASLDITGGNVENWRDQIGTRTFTEATNRPEYQATGGPNGTPCIVFDGVNDVLTLSSVPYPTGGTAARIYAVVSQDALATDTAQRSIFHWGGAGGNQTRGIGRRVTAGVNRAKTSTGSGTSLGETTTTAVDFSGWHWVRGGWTGGAGTSSAQIDGNTPATSSLTVNSGSDRTRVGANSSGTAAQFWHGKISHILVTTDDLTTAEQDDLELWLADRVAGVVPGDALLANDIEAASEVSSPAIGQIHNLVANDVQSASNVSSPALGQVHVLLGGDVESTSEVTSPALADFEVTDSLLADDVEAASEVSAPALGQVHALLADDIEAGSEVSAPTLTEVAAEPEQIIVFDVDGVSRKRAEQKDKDWQNDLRRIIDQAFGDVVPLPTVPPTRTERKEIKAVAIDMARLEGITASLTQIEQRIAEVERQRRRAQQDEEDTIIALLMVA